MRQRERESGGERGAELGVWWGTGFVVLDLMWTLCLTPGSPRCCCWPAAYSSIHLSTTFTASALPASWNTEHSFATVPSHDWVCEERGGEEGGGKEMGGERGERGGGEEGTGGGERERPIPLSIGVYQEDLLFVVIFNSVMSTLADSLKQFQQLGYSFTNSPRSLTTLQYADDTCLVADGSSSCQTLLNHVDRWLEWTGMRAKVPKCHSLALKATTI